MEINWRAVAAEAYAAYAATTNNKNFRGEEMPSFDELPAAIISAWIAATRRVCEVYAAAVTA